MIDKNMIERHSVWTNEDKLLNTLKQAKGKYIGNFGAEIVHIGENNGVYYHHFAGPCYAPIFEITSKVNLGNYKISKFYDGCLNDKIIDQYKIYLTWLIHDSPLSPVFIEKDFKIIKEKGFLFDTSFPEMYIFQAGSMIRECRENPNRVETWNTLVEKGISKNMAFLLTRLVYFSERTDSFIPQNKYLNHSFITGSVSVRQYYFWLFGDIYLSMKYQREIEDKVLQPFSQFIKLRFSDMGWSNKNIKCDDIYKYLEYKNETKIIFGRTYSIKKIINIGKELEIEILNDFY